MENDFVTLINQRCTEKYWKKYVGLPYNITKLDKIKAIFFFSYTINDRDAGYEL